MRVSWLAVGILSVSQGAYLAQGQAAPTISAGQLVHEVIYNELNDHQGHGYWRYWVERHTQKGTRLEEQVETAEGPIAKLALSDGHPPSPELAQEEASRLQHLMSSPEDQARHRQEYADDELRIGRILALLPDAFSYEYDGQDNGCYRLRFVPNPDYPAKSIEARIFHSMSGKLWVNAKYKRLASLDGNVEENVDFGYGILGRLYKGGWFQLERKQVSATDWKTARLEVHMAGRALMFKSIARETSEARGGFVSVPTGLSLAQGLELLASNSASPARVVPAAYIKGR